MRRVLDDRVALWRDLDAAGQDRLLEGCVRFIGGCRWEGIGMEVDPTAQIVVGAHAALMTLGFDRDPFSDVSSVVLYPTTIVRRGVRNLGSGVSSAGPLTIHGETTRGGPVVLVWKAVDTGSRFPERGRNVAIHELAHRLDLVDGVVDGMPPLGGRPAELEWQQTLQAVYAGLIAEIDPFFGRYATTNHGELFAVATERFFTRPTELMRRYPALYRQLAGFFRQDPSQRRPE